MSLWSCATCSRPFGRKADLTRHELIHTGIKPHVCETCGKGFTQFSALKTHRNIHTNAKPFVCGVNTCKKAFADPSSRSRHRKEAHMLGGSPFKCIFAGCEKSIKRRSTFMSHLRKHGIDTNSAQVKTNIARQKRDVTPGHLSSPDSESGSHDEVDSQLEGTASPLGHGLGHDMTDNETSPLMGDDNFPNDAPYDCRRAILFTANDPFFLSLDHAPHVGPSSPGHDDIYSYFSSHFENPSFFNDIFPVVDHSLLTTSHLSLPVLEPFLEVGSDGSRSLSSSPPSTYSTLYPTGEEFDDDMVFLSLANSASHEYLLNSITL